MKWLKERSRQEKWMLALIVVLLVGVIVRWGFIREEAGKAFQDRIDHFKAPQQRVDTLLPERGADTLRNEPASQPEIDADGWRVVRDSVEL